MSEEFTPIETQEAFDAAIKARIERARAKEAERFADYDDLKAKAARLDEIEAAGKSELDAANERIKELEADKKARDEADAERALREKVAEATGVPASLLKGGSEEELTASAKAISAFVERSAPGYPKDKGGSGGNSGAVTRDAIEAIKDPVARVRARAKHQELYR